MRIVRHRDAEAVPRLFASVIRDRDLLRLDFSIFALHLILTANFLVVPLVLTQALQLPRARDWVVYLPVLAASITLMVPAIIVAEKYGRMKEVFLATIVLLAASQVTLALWGTDATVVVISLVGFFTAFNIMEAMLPSHVTKVAPADAKGTATGIYSSAQFLGIFVGGAGGGLAATAAGARGVFMLAVIVAVVWLVIASTMHRPGLFSSYLVRTGDIDLSAIVELTGRLQQVPGVVEAVIAPDEGIAYLKIERSLFDASEVARIMGTPQ